MTRLSGIRVFALSIVLWALAAWIFGPPDPAAPEAAAPETAARAVQETKPEPGTAVAEGVRADAVVVPAPPDPADPESASPPGRDADSASASSRTSAARAADPPAAPVTPPARTAGGGTIPAMPAAAGDGSQIAHAPIAPPAATAGDPAATIAVAPRAATAAAGRDGAPIASPGSSAPWLDPPMPRSPLPPGTPARPGGAAVDGGAVAARLDAARRAAWEGRLADALVHYRAAARVRPKSHVVWGEMGNVLWAMGRWPEAAYALEGAATLLVGAGELRAANALLPAVRNIDPNAAHRIQQRLWAASRRPQG